MVLLQVSPARLSHFRLKFDDGSSLLVPADALLQYHLKSNMEVSPDLLAKLKLASSINSLFTKVDHFLSYRPRSVHETVQYLKKNDANSEQISDLVDRLKRTNLLDDTAFANWLVSSRTRQGRSLPHIRFELRHFGISSEDISAALLAISPQDTADSLDILVSKKARSLSSLPPTLLRQKVGNYLIRKGFPASASLAAIDRYLKKS